MNFLGSEIGRKECAEMRTDHGHYPIDLCTCGKNDWILFISDLTREYIAKICRDQ